MAPLHFPPGAPVVSGEVRRALVLPPEILILIPASQRTKEAIPKRNLPSKWTGRVGFLKKPLPPCKAILGRKGTNVLTPIKIGSGYFKFRKGHNSQFYRIEK